MFALLEHTTPAGVHWDLLIETAPGSPLVTWRLRSDPCRSQVPIPAERIADHRNAYLTYEGPISGDRGSVRRIDTGRAMLKLDNAHARIALQGEHLCGNFQVSARDGSLVFTRTLEG